ncbi:hypothetical protein LOTGIDRAFT_111245 [Lottia gigantea]|uniref:Uncharacterized protein n=1 Tax=Lottia gigantea TaxID=225164 RepID=V4ADB2_LOTGI|nr:hypothetical protein LOTGIDRAFT_111245 [Lottia gigantea]ESP01989.1 hypothetical protein LOTGIDRAFT_111245 [Lottia gigantea]
MSSKTNSVEKSEIIELNVGGVFYSTTIDTLCKEPIGLLAQMFGPNSASNNVLKDSKGKYFIDRDGVLFRYVLDYLRNLKIVLPENFQEKERLKYEAEYFHAENITNYSRHNLPLTGKTPGYVTVGYRGTFAFGRDGLADVKFRKLSRIIVCGKVSICQEVFKETLNDSRDPDRGGVDRYSARYFLKHTFLEQAFDYLQDEGFHMVGSAASGTNGAGEMKPGLDTEEAKWQHYNEFVFERR